MTRTARLLLSVAALATATAACTESVVHVDPQFGMAYDTAMAAQIAYPDASYPTGEAVADGARVGLAQTRYRTGEVLQPIVVDTTLVSSSSATLPR